MRQPREYLQLANSIGATNLAALPESYLVSAMAVSNADRQNLHPLVRVFRELDPEYIFPNEPGQRRARNLDRGLARANDHEGWLNENLRRATGRDFEAAEATLGEIRAFGALSSIFEIQPIPTAAEPTPDFQIDIAGAIINVEVTTLHMRMDDARELAHGYADEVREYSGGVRISETVVSPVGVPGLRRRREVSELPDGRPAGPVSELLVARKFSLIKNDCNQLSSTSPGVLWIDLQSNDWSMSMLGATDASPIRQRGSSITSMGIWHGFYARRSDSMVKNGLLDMDPSYERFSTDFEGRFCSAPAISAAILSFTDGLVVFENPRARAPLPDRFLSMLRMLDGYRADVSVMRWGAADQTLETRIQATKMMIDFLTAETDF